VNRSGPNSRCNDLSEPNLNHLQGGVQGNEIVRKLAEFSRFGRNFNHRVFNVAIEAFASIGCFSERRIEDKTFGKRFTLCCHDCRMTFCVVLQHELTPDV
jgi:hypothetical protein